MKLSFDEERMIALVADRLVGRYPGIPAAKVVEVVNASHARFATSSVRTYVPVLVEKEADEELRGLIRGDR